MGEGEVCVAVVSNVGEMENEKIQQKRDHQWLTAGSDVEPLAKKQAKEGSVDEGDSCARDLSEVAQVSIEHDPCVKRLPIEGSNDIKPEPCVEQNMNECSDGLELEPCGRMQTPEALKDIKPNTFVKDPVQQCLNATKQPNCERTQAIESLNYIGVNPCDEQPVKEDPCAMEVDPCGERLPSKVLNDIEIEPIVVQPVKECLNEMELESHGRMQGTGAGSDIDLDPCGRMQTTGARSDIEPEPSLLQPVKECPSETELEACGNMQPAEALNESEQELSVQQPVKESMHEMELEVCGRKQTTQVLDSTGIELSVVKQTTQALDSTGIELSVVKLTTEALNDIDLELSVEKVCHNEIVTDPCTKKEVKEASNDDICSEVSNPNVSPRDNSSSFQTVNSQSDGKVVMKDQVVCGEITSACSGDSSSEGSSSQEEHGTNDTSGTVSTSHVILEVPKHASTSSGIRKITFKFSKRKEDYGSQLSASAAKCMSEAFDNPTRKGPRLTHISEQGLHEPGEVMPGKVIPDSYPTTVKRLLSTGILEGAKVKYISASILRAHEFEEHAGGKTRHPNNHIYLENGKPIYSIIQAMKTAPLSTVDEAIRNVAGSSVNEELLQVWKGNLQRNMDMAKPDNSYHMKLMNLYHSTTRPRSYTPSATVETKRSAEGGHKKRKSLLYDDRDNDLHRLLFMPNGLPDGTELAYYARGKKILDGYKQGNGIVCSHCDNEISPSQFEAHAGWAAKRQPYRHIYISNGVTLHDIALLLANGQSIATSNSDDMCAVCGDRGELIICDGCPHAFHSVCLGQEGVPSEDWHCPYCRDSIGSGRKTASESRPILIRLTRVVKAREYETGGCVICRAHDFSTAEFDDRTVMLCDQCEKEYHVGCLRESGICDLKALPSDKWFCCDHCDMIHGAIQEVVANGAAGISGLALSTINKKHIEKGVFDGSLDEIRWRMLSGKSRYPEHLPLLSRAAAIFRECFDPIVAKSGRDLIPVMVYGRNISGQEFGGIYCVVLMVGSVVVSAGLLRIFGREVAELPLVATSRQHQGKGYFQALFFCIEELLLSLGVEILVLPAAEEAESIWTKKLGFRKMSDERYSQYSRDIQLTIFKGTSMLEKELRHVTL
ncbi:Acyl-CoA N-acyltransferase [Cynara cardunculus var. scolymus]|uniref:Acyl-CoA N-acyltransferase n=1 Tax=Cynara cardunculus var. scolymus TaxID=59895 RepID=A0A124SHG3_CYNCS|nr:Acyl-CoA N-acyltransferase [Cynara cardunculus var. scolymus]